MPVWNEGANVGRALRRDRCEGAAVETRARRLHRDEDDTLPVVRALDPGTRTSSSCVTSVGPGVLNAVRAGSRRRGPRRCVVTIGGPIDDIAVVPRMVDLVLREVYDVVCRHATCAAAAHIGGPRVKKAPLHARGVSLHALAGFPSHDGHERVPRLPPLLPHAHNHREPPRLPFCSRAHREGARPQTALHGSPLDLGDRSAGASRFRLFRWLPEYLRWYRYALTHRPPRRGRRGASPAA